MVTVYAVVRSGTYYVAQRVTCYVTNMMSVYVRWSELTWDLPDGQIPGILGPGPDPRSSIKLKSTAYARARKLILYTSGSRPDHPDVHQADIGILDRLEHWWYSWSALRNVTHTHTHVPTHNTTTSLS